uniref:Cilia- and flagella-associated protein 69 ARM repeats domain-containing protein n=1 Tax=Oryzias sinensis TaxID=183150 RepID=A0A8C7Y2B5_9TELE
MCVKIFLQTINVQICDWSYTCNWLSLISAVEKIHYSQLHLISFYSKVCICYYKRTVNSVVFNFFQIFILLIRHLIVVLNVSFSVLCKALNNLFTKCAKQLNLPCACQCIFLSKWCILFSFLVLFKKSYFPSRAKLFFQISLKPQLLKTLQILSNSSGHVSILHARGAETICLHMNEPDPSGQVLPLSSEILCNLLGRGNKEEVSTQLSSLDCVLSLKEAFSYILQNASQQSDLQLRNDLLMIITVVAENPNSALMVSLGHFCKWIVFIEFSVSRYPVPGCVAHNLGLTYKNENFKMKKMLLNLLIPLSKDLTALQLYEDERVMLSLLMLVRPPGVLSEHQPGSRHWSSIQQEELQLQALVTLTTIAPLMLNDFMSYQGNNYLLLLLDWCASYFQGQSFNAREGKRNKKTQMLHCIRVLQSVTFQGVEFVNQDLCDQGAIHQLLEILMQMEARTYEDDEVAVEIMSDIQLLLSTLCETDLHRKVSEMAIQFLRKGSSKFYSGLGHNKLILSTVDCVWSCIVGCYHTEDYFLEKEGVFLLHCFLLLCCGAVSTSPRCVHGVVLSTLLDLCDNPNTLPHLLTWRDVTGQTAPRLLLQLWREEEEELGVSRNRHGGIVDPQRPLLNCFQQLDESGLTFSSNKASLAVMEVSENLRAKIYFIFYYLGFQELPGLSTEDYVTLSIVKRYLDFKVGEVWEEVSREVRRENVWLFSDDEEALTNICKASEDTTIKHNQLSFSLNEINANVTFFFQLQIKSHQKQEALMAKSWDSYVSRTSSYKVLKVSKLRFNVNSWLKVVTYTSEQP